MVQVYKRPTHYHHVLSVLFADNITVVVRARKSERELMTGVSSYICGFKRMGCCRVSHIYNVMLSSGRSLSVAFSVVRGKQSDVKMKASPLCIFILDIHLILTVKIG